MYDLTCEAWMTLSMSEWWWDWACKMEGGGGKSFPISSEDFNPWPFRKDQLLTYISAAQTQNASIVAAEHAADDITQDAGTHLGLVGENKGQRASHDSSGARLVKPE